MRRDGPYRRLMGPQAEERGGDIAPAIGATAPRRGAATRERRRAPPMSGIGSRATSAPRPRQVGWRETHRDADRASSGRGGGKLAVDRRALGIGRVAAFIGVGVMGALVDRRGRRTARRRPC